MADSAQVGHGIEIEQGRSAIRAQVGGQVARKGFGQSVRAIRKHPAAHIMMGAIVLMALIFHFVPIYGITIAFKRYHPLLGFWSGEWVGFKYFDQFFGDPFLFRIVKNTVVLGLLTLVIGFPGPIVFALTLNEIRLSSFKRTMQTVTYLPHFVSTVVVVVLIQQFFTWDGFFTETMGRITGVKRDYLTDPRMFRPLYIGSGVWQGLGWGTIIYLATIAGINPELYESAQMDGAGRFQQALYVTFPALLPTVTILLILSTSSIVTVGFEKAYLLQNPATYDTSDVIATYVFRRGIQKAQYSYAAAVGLLDSAAAFLMVFASNKIAQKVRGESLW
jgi:putative aldouronate transport system permease protein